MSESEKLERRIELLEQRLVDLYGACWTIIGSDAARELAAEIRQAKRYEPTTPGNGA